MTQRAPATHSDFHRFMAAAMATAVAIASSVALAQSRPQGAPVVDPPRWTTEDTTPEARYRTSKKEAGAAYQEALWECKKMAAGERGACLKQARDQYNLDLAEARTKLGR
ncbi:MAG TPA: hypothetical protein VIT92_08875 [Burkholderiaceae bacterium]